VGTYAPTGFIIVDGREGDDSIAVAAQVSQLSILYGGDGMDTLRSSNAASILIGVTEMTPLQAAMAAIGC
jgi:hypothetical protein